MGRSMMLRNLFLLLVILSSLYGCAITPTYEVKAVDKTFSNELKTNTPTIAVTKFDAFTPSDAVNVGAAFGVLGVLIADAATADDLEVAGIELQKETMKQLDVVLAEGKLKYINRDLMEDTDVQELSKRFKSNRLWGFSALKSEEIKSFFEKNPNVEYGIHITTLVHELAPKIIVKTEWSIYNKDGSVVASIKTQSVKEFDSVAYRSFTEEEQFEQVKRLQEKNIREFVRLIYTV